MFCYSLCRVSFMFMYVPQIYKYFLKKCQLHRWRLHVVLHTAVVMVWFHPWEEKQNWWNRAEVVTWQWFSAAVAGNETAQCCQRRGEDREIGTDLCEAHRHATVTSGRESVASSIAKMNI